MKYQLYGLAALLFFSACSSSQKDKKVLPIYGNRQPVTKMVNGKQVTDTVYTTIPAFKVVNQYGDTITNKNVDGKIYVADFFFTSCPNICPVMQRNMLTVYNAFKTDPDFKILSYTIDPKHDTSAVLKDYATKLGITGNSWWLLNGPKEFIYQIAKNNYLVSVQDNGSGLVHQGYFVLVDKQKRVRGAYDGTDMKQVDQLVADIRTLKQE